MAAGKLEVNSLCEAFQRMAAARPDAVALRTSGDRVAISWRDYAARVERLAAGLDALGVGCGDTLGIMMLNRPEFHLVDTAALHLGATPFSVYNTSAPEQIAYLFGNAGNRVVVCEEQFVPRVLEAQGDTAVEHVVCIDGSPAGTIPLAAVETRRSDGFDFEASWRAVEGGDVATLIYTSGTTGPPKGVELTHANLIAVLERLPPFYPVGLEDRGVSYLPSAHIADRLLFHGFSLAFGMQVTCLDDPKQLVPALLDTRPTFFGGVPRIWEKLMAGLEAAGVGDPRALSDAERRAALEKIGLDQVHSSICGAAPIPTEVLDFFAALGVRVQEVWGMSETTGLCTVNPRDAIKMGSVGVAMRDVELRLADDGEILARGPNIMRGYRGQPEKTAEALDAEGWLATGDIGEIDGDGYLRIVDRKKEIIINAGGKNMSPANIEQKLKAASPLIGQAVAIGDRRPYNVALLVLDPDNAAAWAKRHGVADASTAALVEHEGVRAAIASAVEEANARMARIEQIKRYRILPTDWEPGGEELTPTSKLKRKPIAEKYAAEIDALYAG